MSRIEFTVAETVMGALGVAWSDAGIVGSWMHGGTVARTREQIRRAYRDACEVSPRPRLAAAVADAVALLSGGAPDLLAAQLDMSNIPEFDRRVYEVARTIRPGSTMTYGEVARALGEEPIRAREVGIALARNPFAPIVPCHRIVAANGQVGGYSAPGGATTKRRLLELEGAAIVAPPRQASL